MSTSESRLIYRHDLPVVYGPSRAISSAYWSYPSEMYSVSAYLRGDRPTAGQSAARPEAYR